MDKNIINKVNEVLERNETEVVTFDLTEKESKMLREARMDSEFSTRDKVCIIDLGDSSIKITNINTKELRKSFFRKVDEFMLDEKDDGSFVKFPEVIEGEIEKNKAILPYLHVLGENLMRMADEAECRGFISSIEGEADNFVIRKTFIAKYELLIFNKSNKPYAKIRRLSPEYNLYKPNSKNYIAEDIDSVTCLYNNLDKLLDRNNIEDSDIVISKDSIEKFYWFDNTLFVNPTDKWVNMWWNQGNQEIYRYEPNILGTTNMWGLGLICWQNLLIETGWNGTHVSDSITEEEILIFKSDDRNNEINKQMQNISKSRSMTDEEKQNQIKKAENIEKEIQEIINENEKEILTRTFVGMNRYISNSQDDIIGKSVEDIKKMLNKLDGTMGLDCGFLYFKLAQGVELFKEVAEYDEDNYRSKDGSLRLSYPSNVQSNTIKSEMAKHIKDIVEKESNYSLKYWTVLD